MSDTYLVKGAFISDDYYFVFTETAIKQLNKFGHLTGAYVCPSNSFGNKLLFMKLKVKIVGVGKKYESTNINIDFEKKSVQFNIHTENFQDAFINPTDWIREKGPPWRISGCNCYILTPKSSKYTSRNKELDYYFIDAKN